MLYRLLLTLILLFISSCRENEKVNKTKNASSENSLKQQILNSVEKDTPFISNINLTNLKQSYIYEIFEYFNKHPLSKNFLTKKGLNSDLTRFLNGDLIFHINHEYLEIFMTNELFVNMKNILTKDKKVKKFPKFDAYSLDNQTNKLFFIDYQDKFILRYYFKKTQLTENLFVPSKKSLLKEKNLTSKKGFSYVNGPALSKLLGELYKKITENEITKKITWTDIDSFLGISSIEHFFTKETTPLTYHTETLFIKKQGFFYKMANQSSSKGSTLLPNYAQKLFKNSTYFYYQKLNLSFLHDYILNFLSSPKLSKEVKPWANQATEFIQLYGPLLKFQVGFSLKEIFDNLPKELIIINNNSIIIKINKNLYDLAARLFPQIKNYPINKDGFQKTLLKKDGEKLYFNQDFIIISLKENILKSFTKEVDESYKKTYNKILKLSKLPSSIKPYGVITIKNKAGKLSLVNLRYKDAINLKIFKEYTKVFVKETK